MRNESLFEKHFGANSFAPLTQWYDLVHDKIPMKKLHEKEKSMRGFKLFSIAHFWLFTKPKNATEGSSQFGRSEKLLQGANFWLWVEHISLLIHKVIKWPKHFEDPLSEVFIMTVDGIDLKQVRTLTKHSSLLVDKSYYSKKHNQDGLKYELSFATHTNKLVWMNGPHKAAKHDITVFWIWGLMAKLKQPRVQRQVFVAVGAKLAQQQGFG